MHKSQAVRYQLITPWRRSLITWLVIFVQITAGFGAATVGAIQPTPQMAQAVAQQAGLGEWIANAASQATAWAQPLWGQPKTALAQAAPVLQSFTSTTANAIYGNGDAINVCANYDQDLVTGSRMNITLDTGATVTLLRYDPNIGGNISADPSFAPIVGLGNAAYAVAVQADGKSVVGGAFTDYDGQANLDRIARFNSDGSRDTTFAPTVALNNEVYAVAMQADGKILVGGAFSSYDGQATLNYIVRLNNDGTRDTSFAPTVAPNNYVYAIAVQADGKIVIGGAFSDYNGQANLDYIARLNSDGTRDTSFAPTVALNNQVRAVAVQADGKIVIGGIFTNYNSQVNLDYVARLNGDGTRDTSFAPTVALNNQVRTVAIQADGKIVAGGLFTDYDSQANLDRIARFNSDGTRDTTFVPTTDLNNEVYAIVLQTDDKIVVGGAFTDYDGNTSLDYIARLNSNGTRDTTFALTSALNSYVYAIDIQANGPLVVGGIFTDYNGNANLDRIARLSGDANTSGSGSTQLCSTYIVLPGHSSADLTVSAITSANVTAVSGGVSTATTIPVGENLADNAALVINSYAPGGVTTSLGWWFQGNKGVQTNGANVTQWSDSNVALHVSQGTAANQPTATEYQNFNPVVTFDGSNDYLRNTVGYWKGSTNNEQFNTFVVATNQDTGGVNAVFGESTNAGTQMMFLPYGGNVENGLWGSYRATSNQIGTTGTPYLWSGRFNNSSTPKLNAISQNGKQLASSASTAVFNGNNGDLDIGAHAPNGWYYNGDVAEVVMYATDLNPTQRQQVQSYLALKWGLTLDQSTPTDYLASDGTTKMWDATTTTTYNNNIAGIGYDANSGLNQKQAQSINGGFQPAIGLGTIAASNAANSNSFATDKNFMVWGSNTGSANFGTAYSPTSFSPVAGYFRMARVWKIQESGSVGNVAVQATNADHLLVSSDPTFATGVTEIDMSSGSATVNFTNGQYFTFGRALTAPGGVATNLVQWHKADAQVYSDVAGSTAATAGGNVKLWKNAAQDAYHPSDSAGGDPTYQAATAASNYNPSIFINKNENDYLKYVGRVMPATSNGSVFIIGRIESFNDDIYTSVGYGDNANDPAFDIDVDGGIPYWDPWFDGSSPNNNDTNFPVANNSTHLMGVTYQNNVADSVKKRVSGKEITTNLEVNSSNSENFDDFWIGSDGGGERWNGTVNEIVTYDTVLSGTPLQQVESYLAVKWGLTLDADPTSAATNYDYLASDGTTIWAGNSTNSTYHNNVAAIGRDDAANLNQKQSTSVNSGFQPAIGLGSIAATNAANANSFSANKSFLVWGNDSGSTQFVTTLTGPGGVNVNNRMTRIWKVQNTGNVGQVKFAAPSWVGLGNTVYLVVSNDATFDNTDTFLPLSALTVGSVNYLATDVTLTDGQYFSLATFTTSPGGVNSSLAWWFQGTAGVQTSGGSVFQWNDSSNNTLNVSQATGANLPIYAKRQNFNSIVTFDGTNDYLRNTTGYWQNSTSNQQYNTFVVATNQNTGGTNAAFGESTNAGTQIMFLPYAGNVENGLWGSYRATSNQIGTTGTPYLWSGRFNNSSTPKLNAISQNGKQLASSTSTTAFNGNNGALNIGAHQPSNWYYNGDIAEVVMYAIDLNPTQRQQVQSYLALKWGLTLDQSSATDYLASDGTTVVWNATTAGLYKNNIAGIGLDLNAGLNQKQSQSINTTNSGNLVAMSIGAFATTNALNSGSFAADRSFEVWSDNSGSTTFATLVPGVSNPQLAHMGRIWQVQETGTIGTVRVRITQNAFDGPSPTLIRSTDATFDSSDSLVALTDDGAGNYQAQIDFANGDYFTLANDPIKELFGKTGSSSAIPVGGIGTITTTWQITYNNVTGRLLKNVVLTDTWSAGQTLIPASVQTPGGDWTWSVVNGTTLKFSNPLVVPNGQGIGKSMTIPMPAGVNLGGGGDGYNPAIVLNTGRVYGINHHNNPANLWCFDPITAGFCTGYPKSSGVSTGQEPFALAVQDKVYFNTDATSSGDASTGIYCLDSTTDVFGSCGSNASAKGLGLVYVNTKLYYLKDSASGGGIGCVDPNNSLANCSGYTALPMGVTTAATPGNGGDIFAVGSKIYVSDSNNNLNCYDASTANYCTGWSATPKTVTAGWWDIFPRLNSLGVITGICVAGDLTDATCYNLDGSSPTTVATANVHLKDNYTPIADTYLGTRVFFTNSSIIGCWDWALNSGNGGACTGAYFDANGHTTTGTNTAYGLGNDGSNVYSYGDGAILMSWNPLTGQNPSVNSAASITVDMDSFYSCVNSSPADLSWYRAQVYDTNLDPNTDFEYLNVTVTDPATGAVLFGPVDAVGTSGVFDLSSIPTSYRSLKLVMSGKAANNNAAWADGVGPKASLTYISNTAPQFCFQTTVSADCNINPNLTVSNQLESALTIGSISNAAVNVCAIPNLVVAKGGPSSAVQGTDFDYTLVITNTGGLASSGVITVTDTLTTGLSFVSGSGSGFTCSAVGQLVTCTSSTAIAVNGTATITLTVNPTTTGAVSNTASVVGGGDNIIAISNNVMIMVNAAIVPPTLVKDFVNSNVGPFVSTTLIFTLTNSASDPAQSGIGFTDNLPTNLVVHNPPNIQNTCLGGVGAISATTGSGVITVSGVGMSAGTHQCRIQLDVSGAVATSHTYQNGPAEMTGLTNVINGVTNQFVTVQNSPELTTIFSPTVVMANQPAQLIFTLANSKGNGKQTNISFTDTLPSNLVVANPANVQTLGCTPSGVVTANPGGNTIAVSSLGIAEGTANCSVAVDVASNIAGNYINGAANISGLNNVINNNTDQTLTVNAANIAPTITSAGGGATASISIPENTTIVTTVTASGTAPITYSLVGGADAALFTIDPNTGALSFVSAPDYEAPTDSGGNNVYDVTVRASNSAGTDDQAIAVTVTDVNESVTGGIEYRIAYNSGTGRYEVYMRSTATPSAPKQTLTAQVTLKAPHVAGAGAFTVTTLLPYTGTLWTIDAPVQAPSEDSAADYLSVQLQDPTNLLNWQAGQEILVFSFQNSGACAANVAVMATNDPFNVDPNSAGTNPANQIDVFGLATTPGNDYLGAYGSATTVCATSSLVAPKVILGGPYDKTSGLMNDTLRSSGLLPLASPYSLATATITNSAILSVTGSNAIVDWVQVEVRDATTPATVLARQAGLLQRDGDVVSAVDGLSPLGFTLASGSYHVAVKHRNHLGVMSGSPLTLSTTPTTVDFTTMSGYGSQAQQQAGSLYLLWMGDSNGDGRVIAAGPTNDRNGILSEALADPGNPNHNANYIVTGYSTGDVNLDGRIIAAGPGNDINLILHTVFTHPSNGSVAANFVVQGQLP